MSGLMSISSYLIGTVIILITVLLIVLFFNIRKASLRAKPEAEEAKKKEVEKKKQSVSFFKLSQSFKKGLDFLKKKVSGRDYRYKIPWFLVLGESLAGKSELLSNLGLGTPVSRAKDKELAAEPGVDWWFYDKGVVIEPQGDFVLKADGESFDQRGWNNVLRLFKKHRPKRPLDGVVVTISCSDLLVDINREAEAKDSLKRKADTLYSKLCDLQNQLGIHFPVYVVFTKCDQVAGFTPFSRQLPENLQNNIFGWSNPHSLDAAYSPVWAEEAIRDMEVGLFEAQLELFTERLEVEENDKIFLFPSAFSRLLCPMKLFLDTLFKESAFHSSFFFRGFFFSGSSVDQPGLSKQPVFLKDLFEKKVFLESGLVKIVGETLTTKSRRLRLIQLTFALVLLIGGLGLGKTYLDMRKEKQATLPVLNLIADSLLELQYKKTVDRSLFEKKGLKLLNGMAEVNPFALTSVFLPSSWTSELQSQIVSCMTVAYKEIIMRMMFIELNNKVRNIGLVKKHTEEEEEDGKEQGPGLENSHEFRQLLTFVKSLEELEKNLAIYNNQLVTGSANSREFTQVVAYLYGIDLKGTFSAEALAKLRGSPVGTEILQANVNAKIWELTHKFYDRAYKYNLLNQKLVSLKDLLRNIRATKKSAKLSGESMGDTASGASEGDAGSGNIVVRFQYLLEMLKDIEKDFADPEYSWMVNNTFDLGAKFKQVLESIQGSGFLGTAVYEELKKRGERGLKLLQQELYDQQTRLTGALLARSEDRVTLKYSEKVLTLKKALEDFFGMKFADVGAAQSQMLKELPFNKRLVWNTQLLQQAAKLYEPFTLFLTEKLNNFPVELRPIFEQVARKSLETNMVDIIARSQRQGNVLKAVNPSFRKEMLRSEVLNFKEASPHISRLLEIFDLLGFHETNRNLFRVTATQGNRILRQVDQLLAEGDFYMVKNRDFEWWNGKKSPTLTAYNVNDPEELKFYFSVQQKRIRFLVNEYAIPIVNLLGFKNKHRGYIDLSLVSRWERIIMVFENFEKKKPGNSIDILENFVLNSLDEIALRDCGKEIPGEVLTAKSGDFFLNQRNIIRKRLYQRCQKLSFENDFKAY